MQKLIVFTEEEFNEKLIEFSNNFASQQNKDYGVKIVSNETGKEITDKESIIGCFFVTWKNTFK
jgi:hypothetical protein